MIFTDLLQKKIHLSTNKTLFSNTKQIYYIEMLL